MKDNVTGRRGSMDASVKKELVLEGLCCANCAAKIEEEVNRLDGVTSASMNFLTRTLTIEASSYGTIDKILAGTKHIIKKHEPDIVVKEKIIPKPGELTDKAPDKIGTVKKIILCAGAVLFFIALPGKLPFNVGLSLYLISYALIGGGILFKAARNITRGRIFDENFLMSVATIGAFAIREFPEGVAVMLFYQVGEFLQEAAVNRSRKSISALMDIRPDYANLKTGDGIRRVSPGDVAIGGVIVVKPGEKVPLDGIVIEGKSMLDTSALTGESVPREVETGTEVLAGSINKNGVLTVQVTKPFGESTVSKILDLVQNASSKKAQTENFITRFARYYTPVVVFTALFLAVIPPLIIPGADFSDWVNRALVFLVVSCPCALVVSIPLGFFGGIGGASRNGILIKGSSYLEALNQVDTIVFDKTGTLTKGVFRVTKVESEDRLTGEELLEYAAYAESYSNHPIASSILKAYGKKVNKDEISEYDEISGCGIKAEIRGEKVLAGNSRLMKIENICFKEVEESGTVIYTALNGQYAGYIVISDEMKEDSRRAVRELRRIGVKKLVMLTGDRKKAGEEIGKQLGLDEIHVELLPDQKVERLEALERKKASGGKLLFVGDGINDAPVLARADIGVAMGGMGSDAAIEAADIVLMTDEPSKLVGAIQIAKRTHGIVMQNIIFALGIKAVVLLLGAGGVATLWEAVFADVGVALLAVLNAMRVMGVNK